jgi:hypothetical protein
MSRLGSGIVADLATPRLALPCRSRLSTTVGGCDSARRLWVAVIDCVTSSGLGRITGHSEEISPLSELASQRRGTRH